MRKTTAKRFEFLLDPDTRIGAWLIECMGNEPKRSELIRLALANYFDPPAPPPPPPDPRVERLQRALEDAERECAYLQGVVDGYQDHPRGVLARLRGHNGH